VHFAKSSENQHSWTFQLCNKMRKAIMIISNNLHRNLNQQAFSWKEHSVDVVEEQIAIPFPNDDLEKMDKSSVVKLTTSYFKMMEFIEKGLSIILSDSPR
jgi:tRNA A37 threonylcarbamoyladenosine synthetase subunit TsaC/SUA5/YrdC